jgi:hypothetical protein
MSASNSHHQIKQTTRTVDTKENMSDKSRDPRGSEFTHKNPSTHHYTEHKSRVKANPFSRRIHKFQKISPNTSHHGIAQQPNQQAKQAPIEKTKLANITSIIAHHHSNSTMDR